MDSLGFLFSMAMAAAAAAVAGGTEPFVPADNYLVDCGSPVETAADSRTFAADIAGASFTITTPADILAAAAGGTAAAVAPIYTTARIFTSPSSYSFSIASGRHFIRLHFFPFAHRSFNMSAAAFSVSTADTLLLDAFRPPASSPAVEEFLLSVASGELVISFRPLSNTIAFINAVEVVSAPDTLIRDAALAVGQSAGQLAGLSGQQLLTLYRLNVGGPKVTPENDTLWRTWLADEPFLSTPEGATRTASYPGTVAYRSGGASPEDAPRSVYGTARAPASPASPNMTWHFAAGAGSYLVRLHFCDIVSAAVGMLRFNVYIDGELAAENVDLSTVASNQLAFPYYIDIVSRRGGNGLGMLAVTVGPAALPSASPGGILNGIEVMQMNFSSGPAFVVEPRNSKVKYVVVAVVLVVIAVVVFAVAACLALRMRRKTVPKWLSSTGTPASAYGGMAHHIPLQQLEEATNGFDESLVIGAGGFGKVYRAVLRDGTPAAVKRGSPRSRQGVKEFWTEIELLSGLRHRHLVALIGYCNERGEMILVYEFMHHGALKGRLYGGGAPPLSWEQRLAIVVGAARGLHYLHTSCARPIIHRDVKSGNILLDERLTAKVADFGLSRTGPGADETHVSTLVKGSFGYLDPEYYRRMRLTDKSDVYSFGVLLLEVLCGRPVIDTSLPRDMANLTELGLRQLRSGTLSDIADGCIAEELVPESLKAYGETVEKCLAECGTDRPAMGEVLQSLERALLLQQGRSPAHDAI